jgi:hypothetical protein
MNIKRIFGALLTILGIGGIIYAAILFVGNTNGSHTIKLLATYAIIGFIFFAAGLGLLRTIKESD